MEICGFLNVSAGILQAQLYNDFQAANFYVLVGIAFLIWASFYKKEQ